MSTDIDIQVYFGFRREDQPKSTTDSEPHDAGPLGCLLRKQWVSCNHYQTEYKCNFVGRAALFYYMWASATIWNGRYDNCPHDNLISSF